MSYKPKYYAARNKQTTNQHDAFISINVLVPKTVFELLKQKSQLACLPVSRLAAIAIDNELGTENPFNYPCDEPDTDYVPLAYAEEANKLLNFIASFPKGVDLMSLMLCRREIGLMTRRDFLEAYREIVKNGLVELFKPRSTFFNYAADYMRIRVIKTETETLKKKNRYKKIYKEDEEDYEN